MAAVLPPVLPPELRHELRHELDTSALMVGRGAPITAGDAEVATSRQAIRMQNKIKICYRDAAARDSLRTIWPFALGFFDRATLYAGHF